MKTELDEWLEFSLAWVDEQLAEVRARDEAAWLRFRQALLGPFDD